MICARNNHDLPEENGNPGKNRLERPAESGTFDTEMGLTDPDAQPDQSAVKKPEVSDEPPALTRAVRKRIKQEREIEKQMKEINRLQRLERQQIEERMRQRAKSGTSASEVRHPSPEPQTDPNTYENEPPERDFSPEELSQKQMLALHEILCGKSNTAAAKAAGVNRRTIYRWRQLPAFQAELHRIQHEFANAMQARIAPLASEAVNVIQEALQRGHIPAALDLLKGTKLLGGQPLTDVDGLESNSTNPAVVFPTATVEPVAEPQGETVETVKPQISEPGPTLADLLPDQQAAIAEILAGKKPSAVAKAAGVTQGTVFLWMRKDEAFRRVLRICRTEQQQRLQTQLLNLGYLAIEVLQHALTKRRDVRAAFAILRGLGLLGRESG